MDHVAVMKNLGVNEQEAHIYLTLLTLGGSIASAVAKESGLKRTTVYPILRSLADKGLATVYFRQNKRFWYAQKPARVAQLYEKKLEAFERIIPLLESVEKKELQMSGLRFIETKEELKTFYKGILAEYEDREYRIISSAQGWESVDEVFFVQFRKDRAKAGIRTRLLLSADSRLVNPADPSLLREYKYIPDVYSFRSTIDIYKDKILVVSPELSALAVVIAIPAMTDIFGAIFEMMWDILPDEQGDAGKSTKEGLTS